MALADDKILVCVPSGPYLYTFTNTYGSNLTVYSNDAYIYNVPVGEWKKVMEFAGTYYAVAVVTGRLVTASALNVRNSGSNGVKKWVYDRTYSQQISDPDLYGGNSITPYLLKEYVPAVTSISVTVGGSSGSTSVKVDEQKEIVVTANYDDGSTKTVTTSASLTRGNTNIEIV